MFSNIGFSLNFVPFESHDLLYIQSACTSRLGGIQRDM